MADLIVIVCANCNITVDWGLGYRSFPYCANMWGTYPPHILTDHSPPSTPISSLPLTPLQPSTPSHVPSHPFLLLHSTRSLFPLNLLFSWFLYLPCSALSEARRSPCSCFGGKSGKCHYVFVEYSLTVCNRW